MTLAIDPRIREQRSAEADSSRWWVTERLPVRPLRGLVQGYSDYLEAESQPFRRRHEPSNWLPVIFNFEEPLEVAVPERGVRVSPPAFVAGLHQTWAQTHSPGTSRGLQVNLSPLAARAIFGGIRMSALKDDVLDLRDLTGDAGRVLLERLEAASTSAARFDLLDETLERALGKAEAPPLLVCEAWRRLGDSHGALGVAALAEDLGCSRKTLHAAFDEYIGLPPKTAARVFRFQRAVQQVGHASWPVIAAESGYYDQSHLIRDFRQFTGFTPTEYERLRAGNGGTMDVAPLAVE